MASVKGNGHLQAKKDNVRLDFVIDLCCDELDHRVPYLQEQVPQRVSDFVRQRNYDFAELMEKQALVKRQVLSEEIRSFFCHTSYKELMRDIELKFSLMPKPVEPPQPKVIYQEVIKYVDRPVVEVKEVEVIKEVVKYIPRPEAPKKTVADKVKDRIAERVDQLVSVSGVTKELLARYAPEMEQDPDLREALTNLLQTEKMNVFDP
jgi:hypothetical protein